MIARVAIIAFFVTLLLCTLLKVSGQDGFDGDETSSLGHPGEGYDEERGPYDDAYGYAGEGGTGEQERPNSAKQLQTWDEIEAFVKDNQFYTSVIGFFDATTHAEDFETFKEISMTDGHIYKFAYTTEKAVLEAKKYDGCAVVVFPPPKFVNQKMERTKHRFPGKTIANKQQVVLDFVKTKSVVLAGQYSSTNRAIYDALQKPVVTVFAAIDHDKNAKGFQYLANRVRKIAKQYENKIVFTLADTESYTHMMQKDYDFEEPSKKEVFVGLREGDMFYKMAEKFSVENLKSFVEKFKAGELQGKQKAPSHEDEHDHGDHEHDDDNGSLLPVIAVHDNNVQEVVQDTTRDVMLEFYAPWCGHCMSLKPEYKKVAQYFEQDSGVTVAAFDATAGSVPPQFEVQGYPTLYFVPANKKSDPIPYEGGRSAGEIIDFINAHRTTSPQHSEL